MPKLTCLCDESINLSPIPNSQGFKLIRESMLEKLIEDLVVARKETISDQAFERKVYNLFYEFPQVYECLKCGRLAIFAHAPDMKPTFWFKCEQRNFENVNSLFSLHTIYE